MSQVFFISDLHLDHKNILKFSGDWRDGSNVKEHNEWIVDQWNSVVKSSRSLVFVLGDVAFSQNAISEYLPRMNGRKVLIRGNHDIYPIESYMEHFEEVFGLYRYKEFWLSHAPIHPAELRERRNIHGHVHHKTLSDGRYINACVEVLNGVPISLDQIRGMEGVKD